MQSELRACISSLNAFLMHTWHIRPGMQDERTQKQISRWLRSLIQVQPNFGACISSLNTFFAEHAKLKAPVRPALPAASRASRQQNVFLQVCACPSLTKYGFLRNH